MSDAIIYREPSTQDLAAISNLQSRVFGPGRFARTAYRVREAGAKLSSFCRVATLDKRIVGVVNFTPVTVGGHSGALLLGPFVVDPEVSNRGVGTHLISLALDGAKEAGAKIVLLVGDLPFYARLGFDVAPAGQIVFPGPVSPERILVLEVEKGSLGAYRGLVQAQRG